ncbi:MAG: hypothetical protein J3Q66DRAFT_52971 [Benniella sp.]|nr:MAG: hypothetical protein J3Q66DRAFT_52971 [Benniella sp.]
MADVSTPSLQTPQLPEECIQRIVSNFDGDIFGLHNLLTVHSCFFRAALPHLYRDPYRTLEKQIRQQALVHKRSYPTFSSSLPAKQLLYILLLSCRRADDLVPFLTPDWPEPVSPWVSVAPLMAVYIDYLGDLDYERWTKTLKWLVPELDNSMDQMVIRLLRLMFLDHHQERVQTLSIPITHLQPYTQFIPYLKNLQRIEFYEDELDGTHDQDETPQQEDQEQANTNDLPQEQPATTTDEPQQEEQTPNDVVEENPEILQEQERPLDLQENSELPVDQSGDGDQEIANNEVTVEVATEETPAVIAQESAEVVVEQNVEAIPEQSTEVVPEESTDAAPDQIVEQRMFWTLLEALERTRKLSRQRLRATNNQTPTQPTPKRTTPSKSLQRRKLNNRTTRTRKKPALLHLFLTQHLVLQNSFEPIGPSSTQVLLPRATTARTLVSFAVQNIALPDMVLSLLSLHDDGFILDGHPTRRSIAGTLNCWKLRGPPTSWICAAGNSSLPISTRPHLEALSACEASVLIRPRISGIKRDF